MRACYFADNVLKLFQFYRTNFMVHFLSPFISLFVTRFFFASVGLLSHWEESLFFFHLSFIFSTISLFIWQITPGKTFKMGRFTWNISPYNRTCRQGIAKELVTLKVWFIIMLNFISCPKRSELLKSTILLYSFFIFNILYFLPFLLILSYIFSNYFPCSLFISTHYLMYSSIILLITH